MHEASERDRERPGRQRRGSGRGRCDERNEEKTERRCRGKRYTVSLMIVISLLLNWLLICSLVINLALWHVIIGANYRQKINKIKRDRTDFYVSCTFFFLSKRSDIVLHFLVAFDQHEALQCAQSFMKKKKKQQHLMPGINHLVNFVANE